MSSKDFVEPQKTFAQAKFAIERGLTELGVPLDPRRLEIGINGDGSRVTIIHPTRNDRILIAQFILPEPIDNPGKFDSAPYVAQFECKPVSH